MSRPRPQRQHTRADQSGLFSELDGEMWLAKRLGTHGVAVFGGVTDRPQRIERIRKAICENHLEEVICGRRDGKPSTYTQAFERLYGEHLNGNPTRKAIPT